MLINKFILIIFKRPRVRYIADITDIPLEIRKGTDYLYLLNIIDHFSKYVASYLIKSKKSETILNKIKNFIDEEGAPLEFGFDNGREFFNKEVVNYLNNKNISIIKGKPYHPRSQGDCE